MEAEELRITPVLGRSLHRLRVDPAVIAALYFASKGGNTRGGTGWAHRGGVDMEMLGWLLVAVCIVLVLLPPKYDPAIRLKEWAERR